MSSELPPNVLALLKQRVDTFEKLEVLTILHQAPRATMSLRDLATAMKMQKDAVREIVSTLRKAALVESTTSDEVQLLPPTTSDYEAVKELVRLYDDERLAVVKAISEIAMDRLRNMATRAFSDAFVLRKKPPGGNKDG